MGFSGSSTDGKTIHIELRSGRVGTLSLNGQACLDKLFERSGAIALVEGEDQDEPVELITQFESLKKKPVYHFCHGYDEADIYDQEYEDEEEEEQATNQK